MIILKVPVKQFPFIRGVILKSILSKETFYWNLIQCPNCSSGKSLVPYNNTEHFILSLFYEDFNVLIAYLYAIIN